MAYEYDITACSRNCSCPMCYESECDDCECMAKEDICMYKLSCKNCPFEKGKDCTYEDGACYRDNLKDKYTCNRAEAERSFPYDY